MGDKTVYTFLLSISSKMNAIARVDFEHLYYDATVRQFVH